MAYCENCGSLLPERARFCPGCGAPAGQRPAQTVPYLPEAAAPRREKTPLRRRWWFRLLKTLLILAVIGFLLLLLLAFLATRLGGTESRRTSAAVSTPVPTARPTLKPAVSPTPTPKPTARPTAKPSPAPNGVRPEVKEALDSYEAFMDEYIAFMARFEAAEGDSLLALLGDYYAMLLRYEEMGEKLEALEEEDLNKTELAYYLEVTNRVTQKLLAAAG